MTPKKKTWLIIISILICVIILTIFIPKLWLLAYYNIKYLEVKSFKSHLQPVMREINQNSGIFDNVQEISLYNLKLQVPWGEIIRKNENDEISTIIFGEEGKYMKGLGIANNPANTQYSKELIKTDEHEKLIKLYGSDNLKSEYLFKHYIFQFTPDDINILDRQDVMKSEIAAVLAKSKYLQSTVGDKIYYFDNGNIRGFQYADTESIFPVLHIEFYDNKDNGYILTITGRNFVPEGKNLTQDEVDFILSSIENNN